jgi:hypothetical protein
VGCSVEACFSPHLLHCLHAWCWHHQAASSRSRQHQSPDQAPAGRLLPATCDVGVTPHVTWGDGVAWAVSIPHNRRHVSTLQGNPIGLAPSHHRIFYCSSCAADSWAQFWVCCQIPYKCDCTSMWRCRRGVVCPATTNHAPCPGLSNLLHDHWRPIGHVTCVVGQGHTDIVVEWGTHLK